MTSHRREPLAIDPVQLASEALESREGLTERPRFPRGPRRKNRRRHGQDSIVDQLEILSEWAPTGERGDPSPVSPSGNLDVDGDDAFGAPSDLSEQLLELTSRLQATEDALGRSEETAADAQRVRGELSVLIGQLSQQLADAQAARAAAEAAAQTALARQVALEEHASGRIEDWNVAFETRANQALEIIAREVALSRQEHLDALSSAQASVDKAAQHYERLESGLDARAEQLGGLLEERVSAIGRELENAQTTAARADEQAEAASRLALDASRLHAEAVSALTRADDVAAQALVAQEDRLEAEKQAFLSGAAREAAELKLAQALKAQREAEARTTHLQLQLAAAIDERQEQAVASREALKALEAGLAKAREEIQAGVEDRRQSNKVVHDAQTRQREADEKLTRALRENESLAQNLAQALRAASTASDEARDAQARRLDAELAVGDAMESARRAQQAATAAHGESVRVQQQLQAQSAEARLLLEATQTQLQLSNEALAENQAALTAARTQVEIQARERILAETALQERSATSWRGMLMRPTRPFVGLAPTAEPEAEPTDARRTLDRDGSPARQAVVSLTIAGAITATVLISRPSAPVGLAAALSFLLVAGVCWRVLAGRARLEMVGSVLHIHRGGSHHMFDLGDSAVQIKTEGSLLSRSWKVMFLRRGLSPVVLDRRDVDGAQLYAQLERWR